jgi:hypothetical protein
VTARGTGLLVGLLATLLGYLWIAELRPSRRSPPSDPPPLLDVSPALVARVELEGGGTRLVAVRHDDAWADVDGRPWDAVADLVATLATLRPVMVVDPEPREPADYGLGSGAEHIRLLAADARPLLGLEVGDPNPSSTALYARREGLREVILVGAVLRWELEKVLGAVRSP